MSTLQRNLVSLAPAEAIKTDLVLTGLEITVRATYRREVKLNPETEYEELLVRDYPNEDERLYIDATSDEQWADFLNREITVHELVASVLNKTLSKAPKGAIEQKQTTAKTTTK